MSQHTFAPLAQANGNCSMLLIPSALVACDTPHNHLEVLTGCRVNLKPIGSIQPRIGVDYVFPMNEVTRDDVHHGIYTSLVFEL